MNEGSPQNANAHYELGKFIRLLDRLRDACGRPSLRELSRVSRKVKDLYGRRYPNLPAELSLTALSDVLGGRRKKPPTWNWVALYVLSCQRFAAESGLRPDPQDATLPTWNLRLQAVRRSDVISPADEQVIPEDAAGLPPRTPPSAMRPGLPSSARPEPLSAPAHPDIVRPPDGAPADADGIADVPGGRPGPVAAALSTAVAELEDFANANGPSLSEQRFFAMYGQHGVHLLRHAESRRDHDAEYRLGVLLCIDDRPQESLAWLLRAEAGGHVKARALIESPGQRRAALGHAWKLGSQVAATDFETATMYLERAAQGGHAGAAFELGTLHMEREDPERAAAWFAMAADRGHPLAEWWSDKNRRAASPGHGTASVPTVDELMAHLYGEPPAGSDR
jgi:hypothetical protein